MRLPVSAPVPYAQAKTGSGPPVRGSNGEVLDNPAATAVTSLLVNAGPVAVDNDFGQPDVRCAHDPS